ncbi:MAG TPA: [protein-PII] uridylyltransferase [Pirellulales bacterium]|nr:[protein-PII] uridylyltransferase [Pirellulales bacterium]
MRPIILASKQRLVEGREKLRQRHARGAFGSQICAAMTDLFDTIVLELYEAALADIGEAGPHGLGTQIALVPHGGYGRRDVAPFSDVDLMILHSPGATRRVTPLAERMVRDLFDVGLHLGQSVRTVRDACALGRQDATICTSLIESRYLSGSVGLYTQFAHRFERQTRRRARRLIAEIDEARHEERSQYGETVYLLEPNIKRSQGGLRDIQLLRWVGFARHGVTEPDGLRLAGELSRPDHDHIRRAAEFLLRIRNEMHFHAGKSSDVLDRAEQMRLAQFCGHEGSAGLLPVEQFMQEYFRMTSGVSNIVSRFVTTARSAPGWLEVLSPLYSHRFEHDFRVSRNYVSVNPRSLEQMRTDLAQILRLADVANRYDKQIAHATSEAIRQAVPSLPDEVTPEVASRFLSLMDHPARLGELLRNLHAMGALEIIIPAFTHARSLLQFNEYHKYTVDEHCLRAVEAATNFWHDKGPLGRVYRRIKRKWLLHLALLIHDLGKGFPEDHSDVGRDIADKIGQRLGLPEADTETLKFLVHKHLQMAHLAFRRDTSDPQLIVRFAVEVGSPEALQMLFVLTAADFEAVGPGVLNGWKVQVLTEVYRAVMVHLAGDAPALRNEDVLRQRREDVLGRLKDEDYRTWWGRQLAAAPAPYLERTELDQILTDFEQLHRLAPGDVAVQAQYLKDAHTVEFKIGTYEAITPGVFHKLCGALASQGLQILSAEINTLADGLVFDRFWVLDPDFAHEPPAGRIAEIERAIENSLKSPADSRPAFRRVWRPGSKQSPLALSPLPTQVRFDNSTSDRFTVIEFFAADRMGLLYTITRALFELGLSIAVAKIGTYLDQVVDVFYVTDAAGQKVTDVGRMDEIRARLLAAVEELEKAEASTARSF